MLLSLLLAAGIAHLFPRHVKYLLIAPILGWYLGGTVWLITMLFNESLFQEKIFLYFVLVATILMEVFVHHIDFNSEQS